MSQSLPVPSFSLPIQEAVFWRGVFLYHYGLIEFAVSELVLRALYQDEYRHLGKLPRSWDRKLRKLVLLLDASGPLKTYSGECRNLLSQITLIDGDRHILTHGRMEVRGNAEEPLVHLEWHDADHDCMRENKLPMAQLRYLAEELGAAARALCDLTDRMMADTGLQPIPLEPEEASQRNPKPFLLGGTLGSG
jgi:hypothetical protein